MSPHCRLTRIAVRLACGAVAILTLLVGAGVSLLMSQAPDCNSYSFRLSSNPSPAYFPYSGGRLFLSWNKSNTSNYCSSNAFSTVTWITPETTTGSSSSTGSKYFDLAANTGGQRFGNVYVVSSTGSDRADLTVEEDAASAADLTVTALQLPSTAVTGTFISGSSTVTNNGGTDAPAFRLEYYLSRNANITTSDTDTGSGCDVPGLAAGGGSFQCSGTIKIPAGLSAGAYTIGAIADSGGVVTESDKTNNSRTANILLSAPPAITSISPATAAAGDPGFNLTVTGTGFDSGAVVRWSGTSLSTTFNSSTQLTAVVPASLIASAGTAAITVVVSGVTTGAATFTVNPPGQSCTFSLSLSIANIAAAGGPSSVVVTASRNDCTWTAAASVPWITFPNGATFTGSATLNYNAAANPAITTRTGSIAIGAQALTVNQAGTACVFSLPVAGLPFTAAGGSGSAAIQAQAGCSWTSGSNAAFITVVSGSGSGNGAATFTVASNPSAAARSGTITIANQNFTVTQAGTVSSQACTASVPAAPQVALEGRTELLGDYLLSCAGLTAAVKADVTFKLNTNVTNQLSSGATDAALAVNGTAVTQSAAVAGYNSIRWSGVTITPAADGTASLRISKVRADASLLGTAGNLQPAAITGQAAFSTVTALPVLSALQTVANAAPALAFSKRQAIPPAGGPQTLVPLVFQEGRANAFHASATRLRIVLTNVPGTVQISAPIFPSEGATHAQLISADANGSGGSLVNGNGTIPLTITGGTATATWLVATADDTQIETWTFALLVQNAATGDLNQIQVSGSLAPVSDVSVASATAPVPRFRDFSTPQKLVSLRVSTSLQLGAPSQPSVAPRAPVTTGSNVTFTSQIINDTSDATQTATNVIVRDNLPSGLNLVSCTASGGATCNSTGNQVQVGLGTVGPGQGATVTVVAQVDPSLANGTLVENPVTADSDQADTDVFASTSSTSFIVLNGVPVSVGSSPAFGSGNTQQFSFQFSHPAGYQNLGVVDILINNFLDGRNACYLAYVVQSTTLVLVNDAGQAGGPYAGSLPLGSASIIQNSQCMVGLVSAVGNGTNLTLTLNITFLPAFGGNRLVYIAARDNSGGNSDWQPLGTWQVPFAPPGSIAVSGMTLARGAAAAGTNQQFRFTLNDSKGAGDFGIINVLVNNFIDGRKACYVAYSAQGNTLFLVDDAGDAGGPFSSMVLNGSSGSVENGQCSISGTGSTAAPGPNSITLTLNITFKSGFAGNRVFYVAGRDRSDGNNTDWQAVGTWTVQ